MAIRLAVIAMAGLWSASGVSGTSAGPPESSTPILLGDGGMIESSTGPGGIRMVPARRASPGQAPPPSCRMPTVLRDGERSWKLYGRGDAGWVLAVSTDGMAWREAPGALKVPADGRAGFTPFLDDRPGVPGEEKYKALGGSVEVGGLFVLASADGRAWGKLAPEPVIASAAEEAFYGRNSAVWSAVERAYVAFVSERRGGRRVVSRSTSKDFRRWSRPSPLKLSADGEDVWSLTVWSVDTNPPLLMGLLTRTAAGKAGPADLCLATSRDGGRTFARPAAEAWIRPPAGAADWRAMVASAPVAFVRSRPWTPHREEAFYAGGRRYEVFHNRLLACAARALTPALPADDPGAWASRSITTRPFVVTGSSLELNASTDSYGTIRVEILGADGKPLPGYRQADSRPDSYIWVPVDPARRAAELRRTSMDIYGDSPRMRVCWRYKHRGNPEKRSRIQWWPDWDLGELKGRTVRLRFVMNGADLFGFRTVDRPPQEGKPVVFSKQFPAGMMMGHVEAGQ